MKAHLLSLVIAATLAALPLAAQAPQAPPAGGRAGGQGGRGAPPATPRTTAPMDLTGNWVAFISEDWRWRMVTPAKGDYLSIPLTQAGKDAADRWDPARDTAAGEQCRSYGAPGLMRSPTRLRITWANDTTLQVDSDYGMQTRLLRFGAGPATGAPSWQGHSAAEWERGARGRGTAAAAGPAFGAGSLTVVTTNLRPGYVRKNGVPYSANTVLTEYWDTFQAPDSNWWLVITTVVRDPVNLQGDWITSLHFKREADGSKWRPTSCNATW